MLLLLLLLSSVVVSGGIKLCLLFFFCFFCSFFCAGSLCVCISGVYIRDLICVELCLVLHVVFSGSCAC